MFEQVGTKQQQLMLLSKSACKWEVKYSVFVPAIDYINYLVQQKAKQEDDLEKLRKEVKALRIMKE